MTYFNYSHLYSWRNICEYLNSRPYKFAEPDDIKKNCKALPMLYSPSRVHRQRLFDDYLIQFMHWCLYPELVYTRRRYRRRKEFYGWQLCKDWEFKIDYLESIVLFGVEPDIKIWEPALKSRMELRREKEKSKQMRDHFNLLSPEDKKIFCYKNNLCLRCQHEIIPLMVDCVNCGYKQD